MFEQTLNKIRSFIDKKPEFEAYQDYFDVLRAYGKEDKKKSFEHNLWLRKETAKMVKKSSDPKLVEQFYNLNKKTYLYMAQDDFHSYLTYIEWDAPPTKQFYRYRQHYLRPIVKAYQEVLDGKLDLLTISLPKRAGKSQLGINFVNMISGKYPNRSTLMEGIGDPLVKSFYAGCLEYLVPDSVYKFYDVFPDSKLVETNADLKKINLQTKSRFPTIMCRSIDSSQVGLSEASNILYLDDCVDGRNESINQELLEKKWSVISGDVIGRAIGVPIVICGTRYSLYDPIGRLQEYAKKQGWRYRIVEIPALDPKTDESNFEYYNPEMRTKVLTTKYFRDFRDMLTPEQWASEFQQQPIETRGILYDRDELRRYFELPKKEPDAIIAICDPKEKGTDYAFLPIVYVYGNDFYIEDCICSNEKIELLDERMVNILVKHKVKSCRFESNSAGWRTAEKIQNKIKERGGITHITTKRTTQNKEIKIHVNSAWVKEHCLFKDDSVIKRGSEYWMMLNFLCTWSALSKNKHDDVPDGMAMLAEYAQNMIGSSIEIMDRRWL